MMTWSWFNNKRTEKKRFWRRNQSTKNLFDSGIQLHHDHFLTTVSFLLHTCLYNRPYHFCPFFSDSTALWHKTDDLPCWNVECFQWRHQQTLIVPMCCSFRQKAEKNQAWTTKPPQKTQFCQAKAGRPCEGSINSARVRKILTHKLFAFGV